MENHMDWLQVFTIIGSLGAFTFWLFNKLDTDIKAMTARHDSHSARIDQLYQMFVDLLKAKG